jgi:hypothetical protein
MKKYLCFLILIIIFSLNIFGQKKKTEIISVSENRVIAVRKVIFSIEAADKIKHETFIEIEMEGNFNPGISNCCDPHAFIDGVPFWLIRGTEGRFFIKMDQKTFKNLKNNSEIFASSVPPNGLNKIAEDYRDKKSSFMNGVSFGKLQKKLIKRFPTIKENQQSYAKRVWNAQ